MPVRWDADTHKTLLLAMIHGSSALSKDQVQEIISIWPHEPVPTERAIQEQVKVLRKQAEAHFGSDNTRTPATPSPAKSKVARTPVKPSLLGNAGKKKVTPSKRKFNKDDDESEEVSSSAGGPGGSTTKRVAPRVMPNRGKAKKGAKVYIESDSATSADEVESADGDFVTERDLAQNSGKDRMDVDGEASALSQNGNGHESDIKPEQNDAAEIKEEVQVDSEGRGICYESDMEEKCV